jgi:meso-butanediol dehydrogenase / (S,S)-butanediol dehydrogenase / diacetyl reductase
MGVLMKLEGKVAIVTGGGQGLGQGIVRCLAEEGADIVIADIKEDAANKTADEVRSLGRKALPLVVDLTDSEQVRKMVQDALDTFGRIDILVNNVGGSTRASLERASLQYTESKDIECDQMYMLNFKIHTMVSRAVIPHLIEQKSGKILNISSIAGKGASTNHPFYGAMKAGILSLTKTLARELGEFNINVNAVCPGLIYTPANWGQFAAHHVDVLNWAKGMTPREYFLKAVSNSPLKREQTPEDIGRAVVFLVSEDARNITGQSLNVDGGLVMS